MNSSYLDSFTLFHQSGAMNHFQHFHMPRRLLKMIQLKNKRATFFFYSSYIFFIINCYNAFIFIFDQSFLSFFIYFFSFFPISLSFKKNHLKLIYTYNFPKGNIILIIFLYYEHFFIMYVIYFYNVLSSWRLFSYSYFFFYILNLVTYLFSVF